MRAIYGLYDTPDAAQRAYRGLQGLGIATREITVVSSEPFEAFEFSHRDHSMILFRLALLGGIAGLVFGVLLTRGTELAWPLVTGGMPIVAWWPNLVIIFELTFFGAITTTAVSLLVSSGLPSFKRSIYDPAVADGNVLVGVPLSGSGTSDAIRDALSASGALAVKTAEW